MGRKKKGERSTGPVHVLKNDVKEVAQRVGSIWAAGRCWRWSGMGAGVGAEARGAGAPCGTPGASGSPWHRPKLQGAARSRAAGPPGWVWVSAWRGKPPAEPELAAVQHGAVSWPLCAHLSEVWVCLRNLRHRGLNCLNNTFKLLFQNLLSSPSLT